MVKMASRQIRGCRDICYAPKCPTHKDVCHGKQEGFEEEVTVPLARMEYGSLGQCYVLLKREAGSMTMGKLGACMQFTVKEIDPSTGDATAAGCNLHGLCPILAGNLGNTTQAPLSALHPHGAADSRDRAGVQATLAGLLKQRKLLGCGADHSHVSMEAGHTAA